MSEYTTFLIDPGLVSANVVEVVDAVVSDYDDYNSYTGVEYLTPLTSSKKRLAVVNKAVGILANVDFDSIAFIGMSGALLAPVLAFVMGKELIALRKHGSQSHSWHSIEGFNKTKRYIVVDDFICTGNTVRDIAKRMEGFAPGAEYVGTYAYNDQYFHVGHPGREY